MTGGRHMRIQDMLLAVTVAFVLGIMAACGGGGTPPATIAEQNSVVVGDFNGDGRLDLAVSTGFVSGSTAFSGDVEVLLQDRAVSGSFFQQGIFSVGIDPFHLAAADLNGDGLPDLITANTGSDTVSVLLNNPLRPGSFFSAVDFPCGPGPLSVATGDLNRDGLPDIAVAVADGVDILFQNPASRGTFFPPAFQALGGGTFSVAVGDLDGDGFPDIAAAGLDAVHVFFQDPLASGTFFLPERFAAGLQPNAVVAADFDRDGLLDIAVANTGSSVDGSGASISVLLQDPQLAGNFLAARSFATPNGAQNLAVGDLDGDGFPDIVVASVVFSSPNPGIVSLFLQNSAAPGNFLLASTHPDGFTPQSVAIGDLDNDGRPDIAIQDGPSILFQDPLRPGTFFEEVLVFP